MSQNTASLAQSAPNVFINYRRGDTAGHAGRLFDRLSGRLPGRVFMDVDTVEPGVGFAEVIDQAVGKCEVLIVILGRGWLKVTDAAGARRLDNPKDFVRLEVGRGPRAQHPRHPGAGGRRHDAAAGGSAAGSREAGAAPSS